MKRFGEVWIRRPILWVLSAYITGLVVSIYIKVEPLCFWLGMVIVVPAALFYGKKALFPMLLGLSLLFGCFRSAVFYQTENPLSQYINQRVTVQGIISGAPQVEPDKTVYILHVNAVLVDETVYPADTRVKISCYLNESNADGSAILAYIPFNTGDLLQVSGVLKEPSGPRNPKGFDYKSYLARRGIYSTMSAAGNQILLIRKGNSFSFDRSFAWLRSQAESALDRSVGGREGDLLKAMLLGERWLIEPQTEDDFSRTGLAHVLAISGLHVGYIVLLLSFLCSLFKLGKRTSLFFQTAFLILYCALVGAAPSVIRAVTMAVIYFIGKALGRKTDIINSAGAAALVILLFKPMDILEVGFQLSFAAVCSIALFSGPVQKKLGFLPSKVSSLTAAALSAQLGTLPLTIYHFNFLSPLSVLANLVVIPVIGFAVLGGFLILPLTTLLPGIAGVLGAPIRLLCTLILHVTGFAADLPFAFFRVISPSIAAILVCYAVLWLLSRERPGFVKKPYFVSFLLIAILFAGQLAAGLLQPKELKLVFLDVGQGDCSFIQTPDGKNILIDGGGRPGTDIGNKAAVDENEGINSVMADSGVGEETVVPFLLKNGISSLDLVIMSHSHDDHIGGLIPVMDQLKVKAFMEYPPGEESPAYQALKNTVCQKGIEVISASRGQSYRIGEDVWLHILYPDEKVVKALSKGNENNYSLVILLEYRDTSVLFAGDIEKGVEYYLSGRMGAQADILKVPHHGSSTSSTEPFLDAVSPNKGIIQVGTNVFGHPSPQTLDRLVDRGVQVFRNDEQGAVLLRYRDHQWIIRTMFGVPENKE